MCIRDRCLVGGSDWIVDLGPGAGIHGGSVVFEGTVDKILNGHKSITGDYLKNNASIKIESSVRNRSGTLKIMEASENNLKKINVDIPLGLFVSVTGVSGSGKSTLVNDILLKTLENHFYRSTKKPGEHRGITGLENID